MGRRRGSICPPTREEEGSNAVTLQHLDPTRDPLDDDEEDEEVDIVDPEGVFEGLNSGQLTELEKHIDTYIALESNGNNLDFGNGSNNMSIVRRRAHSIPDYENHL